MLEVQKRLPWWRLFLLSLAQKTSVDTGHNQQWEAAASLASQPSCNKWCSVWLTLIIELTGSKQ
jgi:hypothetical protein